MATMSLETIFKRLKFTRLCISSDIPGRNWVIRNTPQNKLHTLCFHDPNQSALDSLGLDFSEVANYTEFGKDRFIKLTTFKWQIIRDSLQSHPDSGGVLFSDLDVIWFSDPFYKDINPIPEKILAQDDTPQQGENIHACSGIMFFPRKKPSVEILNILFEKQLNTNKKGILIPDEPILNQWLLETKVNSSDFSLFDSRSFVIGHRFLHSLFWRKNRRENMICFHINYIVGDKRKSKRARAILSRQSGDLRWIKFAVIEFVILIFTRLFLK
jgi:hypothetical protein